MMQPFVKIELILSHHSLGKLTQPLRAFVFVFIAKNGPIYIKINKLNHFFRSMQEKKIFIIPLKYAFSKNTISYLAGTGTNIASVM